MVFLYWKVGIYKKEPKTNKNQNSNENMQSSIDQQVDSDFDLALYDGINWKLKGGTTLVLIIFSFLLFNGVLVATSRNIFWACKYQQSLNQKSSGSVAIDP